jgi:Matrixin
VRHAFPCLAVLLALAAQPGGPLPNIAEWAPAAETVENVSTASGFAVDKTALDEMLWGSKGMLQYWTAAPELVVLMSVMEYRGVSGAESIATAEQLTVAEADALEADLTGALRLLTGDNYQRFAGIHREVVPVGEHTRLSRSRQIVVGRYSGLRRTRSMIGFGGRAARTDGRIIGGAILLDRDYDETSELRRLLRMHELGHALGFNHVQAQTSIMNPAIGPDLTGFDRVAIRIAFDRAHNHAAN